MKTGTAKYKAACHVRQRRRSMRLRQRIHELEAQNRELCRYAARANERAQQEHLRANNWEALYRGACDAAAGLVRDLRATFSMARGDG